MGCVHKFCDARIDFRIGVGCFIKNRADIFTHQWGLLLNCGGETTWEMQRGMGRGLLMMVKGIKFIALLGLAVKEVPWLSKCSSGDDDSSVALSFELELK